MFGNIKSKLALAAVVAVGAVALPSAAQADRWTQGGVVLPNGGTPVAISADGPLTLTATSGFAVTCTTTISGAIRNEVAPSMGRANITAVTFSGCTTNFPGCTVVANATGLPWTGGTLNNVGPLVRLAIPVTFTNTFGGTCPAGLPTGVPISESGTLNPIVPVSGGVLNFDGGANNTVTGPLGAAIVTGNVTITSPTNIGVV